MFSAIYFTTPCAAGVAGKSAAGGNRSSSIKSQSRQYSLLGLGNEYDVGVRKNKTNVTKSLGSGRGISAWGLIFVILLIIMIGVVAYYTFFCFPFMCSKERKYNIMSSNTVTPTTSREFEYESSSSKSSHVEI
jgi:hypothetical protein